MKVNVKNLPNCGKEMSVEVPADRVQTEVDALYERIAREAKIDGFRKGKAPLNIVRQRFKENVKREVTDEIMPRFFQQALDEEKLVPVSKPRVKDFHFEEGEPLKFTANFEVRPDFSLKNYKGIKVKKESVEVTESDVDRVVESLRERVAQYNPVEDRPLAKDDLALIDFEGRKNGVPFEGGKAERYPLRVGSGDMIPGFEDALLGMRKGETKTFPIQFPKDYPQKDLAGQKTEFTVTLQEIKERKLPPVDDEFAKSVSGSDTVAAMRERILAQLKKNRENEQRSKMLEQVLEKLLKDHKFDVPETWVSMETFQLIRHNIQQMRQHGVDPNRWDEKEKKEFNERMKSQADRNVRVAVLVDRVAEAENVECKGSDWEAYLAKVAADSGQSVEAVKQYVKQQGNEDQLKDRIRHEKTMDLLLDVANIEQK